MDIAIERLRRHSPVPLPTARGGRCFTTAKEYSFYCGMNAVNAADAARQVRDALKRARAYEKKVYMPEKTYDLLIDPNENLPQYANMVTATEYGYIMVYLHGVHGGVLPKYLTPDTAKELAEEIGSADNVYEWVFYSKMNGNPTYIARLPDPQTVKKDLLARADRFK